MLYKYKLAIRLTIAFLSLIFYKLFYIILIPLTFYSSYYILKLLNFSPTITDNIIKISNYNLKFIPACAAVSAYLLLVLLITLTKNISFKKSLLIFITGSFLILAMNILRIELLIIILIKYGADYFNTLHLFFWKILSTVYVALLWILLTKLFKIEKIPVYSDIKFLIRLIKK